MSAKLQVVGYSFPYFGENLYQHESHCQPLLCCMVMLNVMAINTASYLSLCGTCDEYSHVLKSLKYTTK